MLYRKVYNLVKYKGRKGKCGTITGIQTQSHKNGYVQSWAYSSRASSEFSPKIQEGGIDIIHQPTKKCNITGRRIMQSSVATRPDQQSKKPINTPPTFIRRIGGTLFTVSVYSSQTSKETNRR